MLRSSYYMHHFMPVIHVLYNYTLAPVVCISRSINVILLYLTHVPVPFLYLKHSVDSLCQFCILVNIYMCNNL